MTLRLRLRMAWALLAAAGLAAVAADVAVLRGGARADCPAGTVRDPYAVAARFLTTAVQRRDLAASYRLASPSLRAGRTCAQWTRGALPVRAFRDIDWSRAAYQTVAGGEGQLVLRVLLYRPGETLPVAFLMEIQTDAAEPGWHVGYFAPDRWYRPTLHLPSS